LDSGVMKYEAGEGRAEAYFADAGRGAPAVLVLHEVWGMTPFVRSVCSELAAVGFSAFAPDLYWRDKELFTGRNIREAMEIVWDLPLAERFDADKLSSAVRKGGASPEARTLLAKLYAKSFRSLLSGDVRALARAIGDRSPSIGVIGYSMGGGFALRLAVGFENLRACVTFSSEPPSGAELAKIHSPMMSFYGSEDRFMAERVPTFVAEALRLGRRLTLQLYPGAGHEFFNKDDVGYEPVAAADSWAAVIRFLDERLRRTGSR